MLKRVKEGNTSRESQKVDWTYNRGKETLTGVLAGIVDGRRKRGRKWLNIIDDVIRAERIGDVTGVKVAAANLMMIYFMMMIILTTCLFRFHIVRLCILLETVLLLNKVNIETHLRS